jgi:hypothetical protein
MKQEFFVPKLAAQLRSEPGLGWSSYRTWMLAVATRLEEALRKSPVA